MVCGCCGICALAGAEVWNFEGWKNDSGLVHCLVSGLRSQELNRGMWMGKEEKSGTLA
jgi:hypothetical protein